MQNVRWAVLGVLLLMLLPVAAGAQSPAQNKADVAAILAAVYEQGDTNVIRTRFADSFVRQPGDVDRTGLEQTVLALRAAMPNMTITIDVILAEADKVAVRYQLLGDFTQEMIFPNSIPIAPTGEPFLVTSHSIFTLDANGQIIREDVGFDNLGFLVLIGALTPPPQTGVATPALLPLQPDGVTNPSMVDRLLAGYQAGGLPESGFAPMYTTTNMFGTFDYAGQLGDLGALKTSFPSLSLSRDRTVTEGNWTAVHYTLSGRFLEPYTLPNGDVIEPLFAVMMLSMEVLNWSARSCSWSVAVTS